MSGAKCSKHHRNKTLNIRIQIQIDKIKFRSQQNPPTASAGIPERGNESAASKVVSAIWWMLWVQTDNTHMSIVHV
jgi:hypothetical protein